MASAAILAGTAILFLGATATLVAPLKEFVDAGWKQRFNKGGRFLGYVGALIAYMGALSELGSSKTAIALITVVPVIVCLLAILIIARVQRH
jgi:hypothetical protein